MTNRLEEFIYKRRSVRRYIKEPLSESELKNIASVFAAATPLYPDVKVRMEIIKKGDYKSPLPWVPEQVIAVFSEEKEGYLENAGFILQQVELVLQSEGIGTCWLGLGKPETSVRSNVGDDLKFVIMMAVGKHKTPPRSKKEEFNRKPLEKIADFADERLEPARYAPSSINSQPWFFTHDGDVYHLYCGRSGVLKIFGMSEMNRIDCGIALAHLYITHEDFEFFKVDASALKKGYLYIGSFKI